MTSLNDNKKISIVISKNEKDEYISELIFEFNDEEKLQNYLKLIIEKGFDNMIDLLNIKENEKKYEILDEQNESYGYAYEIIPLKKKELKIKEEILNMIRIYLYNKDIMNKIEISKTENNNKEKIKEYIFNDTCYLINRHYLRKYKEIYLYNCIQNFLDEKNNNININKEKLYSKENIDLIYEKMQKEDFFKNYINKERIAINTVQPEDITKREIVLDQDEKKVIYNDEFILVNKDIYEQILLNENNDLNKHEFLINSGKIFLFFDSNETNQLLIGEIKDNENYFNIINIIVFNTNKELNTFKEGLSKEYFFDIIKYLYKKRNQLISFENKIIGLFAAINKDNDLFNKVIEKKDDTDLLISEIYINFERIKKQIKEGKFNEEEKYYIMNNNWFKYLNENYNYDSIIKSLNENDKFKKYLEDVLNKDKFEFKNEIVNEALKGKNASDKNIKLKEEQQKQLEIENNYQKIGNENNEKIYLDKFLIINEKIKDLLKTIFEIDSEKKYFISVNCLFKSTNKTLNDSFISIFYSLKDSSLINVGNFYGKEFLYETNILFEINDKKYFDELLTKKELNTNLEKKIESLFDNNNKDDEKYLKLENENKAEIGIAYLIKINENKVQRIDTS